MNLLALDIGGAYIKSSLIKFNNSNAKILINKRNAFNFRVNSNNLDDALSEELQNHVDKNTIIDMVIITITAETIGIFNTIKDGVIKIAKICEETFFEFKIYYISTDGNIHNYNQLKNRPMDFASANWVATSKLAAKYIEDGLFIDMGTTTTDIIPIKNKIICPTTKTDMARLVSGELLYMGLLRTYISNIVDKLPFNDTFIPLASEIRCFTAHIYVALGMIKELEMLHPFSGKKIKITRTNSLDAIARSVCADKTLIECDKIVKMANYVYKKQMEKMCLME